MQPPIYYRRLRALSSELLDRVGFPNHFSDVENEKKRGKENEGKDKGEKKGEEQETERKVIRKRIIIIEWKRFSSDFIINDEN